MRRPNQGPDCCADVLEDHRVHDISSDEEPLVPSSRNVVPRLSGVDSTIPATSRTLVQAGRELSPAVTEIGFAPDPPTPVRMTQIRKSSEAGCVGFAALSDARDDGQHLGRRGQPPARRRLVLVSQHEAADSTRGDDHEWEPDTESIEGMSDVEVHDVVEPTVVAEPSDMDRVRAPGGAFSSLDAVSLITVSNARPV